MSYLFWMQSTESVIILQNNARLDCLPDMIAVLIVSILTASKNEENPFTNSYVDCLFAPPICLL